MLAVVKTPRTEISLYGDGAQDFTHNLNFGLAGNAAKASQSVGCCGLSGAAPGCRMRVIALRPCLSRGNVVYNICYVFA